MIENNSERHFPTLNRHKREYFNLGRGASNSNWREDSPSSQYLEEGKNTIDDEMVEKRTKLELETPELVLNVKNEKEDSVEVISAADESNSGGADEAASINVVDEGKN